MHSSIDIFKKLASVGLMQIGFDPSTVVPRDFH